MAKLKLSNKEYDEFLLMFIKSIYEDNIDKRIGMSALKIIEPEGMKKKRFEFKIWIDINGTEINSQTK